MSIVTLTSTYFVLGIRNVLRNKKRSCISIAAVALGVWSSVALSTLARGVSYGMAEDTISTLSGHIQIHAPRYLDDPSIEYTFPEAQGDLRAKLNQASRWSERVRVPGVAASERESFGVAIVGIDAERERGLSFVADAVIDGEFLSQHDESGAIVGAKLLERLQTGIGKRIVLMSEGADHQIAERGFRIRGVFKAKLESTELGNVFVSKKIAQQFLGIPGKISEIALRLPSRERIPEVESQLREVAGGLAVDSWESLNPFIVALISVQGRFISFWFVVVFVAVSFGLINTMLMAIFERSRELGLFQALGMKPPQIITLILIESLVLILAGAAAGNILGLGTMWWLRNGLDISAFAAGAEHIGISRIIYPKFLLADWIKVNVILFVMGILSSLYPAYRASTIAPAAALTRS